MKLRRYSKAACVVGVQEQPRNKIGSCAGRRLDPLMHYHVLLLQEELLQHKLQEETMLLKLEEKKSLLLQAVDQVCCSRIAAAAAICSVCCHRSFTKQAVWQAAYSRILPSFSSRMQEVESPNRQRLTSLASSGGFNEVAKQSYPSSSSSRTRVCASVQ